MPKTVTPRTASARTRRLYAAVLQTRGQLSPEAQALVRTVRGQAAANKVTAARRKSKAY